MALSGYGGGGSFICRLDPRIKIAACLLFTLLVFVVSRPPAAACLTLCMAALWFAARMKISQIFTYLKFLLVMVLFITALQMLFGPGSRYIVKPLIPDWVPLAGGMGSLKWDGLALGAVAGLRLLSLVLLLPLLTGTTSMYDLAQGLAAFGLNYKAAFVITSALNLVPGLKDEARFIVDAQKLRGRRVFDEGSLWGKLRTYPALAVPLIIAAMRRSQSMAYAMDSRAFGAGQSRTWRKPLVVKTRDWLALAVSIIVCGCVLFINFFVFRNFAWQ